MWVITKYGIYKYIKTVMILEGTLLTTPLVNCYSRFRSYSDNLNNRRKYMGLFDKFKKVLDDANVRDHKIEEGKVQKYFQKSIV